MAICSRRMQRSTAAKLQGRGEEGVGHLIARARVRLSSPKQRDTAEAGYELSRGRRDAAARQGTHMFMLPLPSPSRTSLGPSPCSALFTYRIYCGVRIGTSRQERAKGLEVAIEGCPVQGSVAGL